MTSAGTFYCVDPHIQVGKNPVPNKQREMWATVKDSQCGQTETVVPQGSLLFHINDGCGNTKL